MTLARKMAFALLVLVALGGALALGLRRLQVDADLTRALPTTDPVINDARYVLSHHPSLERIYVDMCLRAKTPDPRRLIRAAERLEKILRASGELSQVGFRRVGEGVASLYAGIPARLPTLFSRRDLEREVAPLLEPERITAAVMANRRRLLGLDGIGQARAVAADPLSLRDLVMARLSWLRPSDRARIRGGQLVTRDGRHLLLVAEPKGVGVDTSTARRLTRLLEEAADRLDAEGLGVRLTPVGAFRAALDNETIVRRDTQRAMIVAMALIVALLFLCSPRPLLGLLALLPAAAGAVTALLIYSLIHPRISALALGFGGALISITVDHGIAYLLFLEQEQREGGRRAARHVWAVGLLATVTTSGAFGVLTLSGFPLLAQVGLFAAIGVAASFAFVHLVFPLLFAGYRGGLRAPLLPADRLLARLGRGNPWLGLLAAALVVLGLGLFARPRVGADLESMSTVTEPTRAAERHLKEAWGDLGQRVWVLLEGRDAAALQAEGDRLAELLDGLPRPQVAGGFSPSYVYPGPARTASNLRAWRAFWSPARRAALRRSLAAAADRAGFATAAFEPFLSLVAADRAVPALPPPAEQAALGITRSHKTGHLLMLAPVARGARFDADGFGQRASGARLRVFDPRRFASRLSGLIASTFLWMLALVGVGVLILLGLALLDWRLVLLALTPLALSLACTLGALRLLGRPLDIPGLMLAIVVVGMGLDYALYLIRAHLRYLSPDHPGHSAVRLTVFLAGASTFLGFFGLVFSGHAVLRSAGVVTSLGIFFALVGALVLLPPVLRRLYPAAGIPEPEPVALEPGSRLHSRRVARRYGRLSPYPRLFSWFKVRTDPMFPMLAELVPREGLVVDVGCGYGVPAVWLLACRPGLRIIGLEPDQDRARIARWCMGSRGEVLRGLAEGLPLARARARAVLLLDVIHHLDDQELSEALTSARACLAPGGVLLLRATVPGSRWPWERRLEELRVRLAGQRCHFRDLTTLRAALEGLGLQVTLPAPAAKGREETFLLARAPEGER